MPEVIRQIPLYGLLWEIKNTASNMEKKILDCGAGGRLPPLVMFHDHGFETYGIDISEEQISKALDYAKQKNMDFNIIQGDMRELPYEDEFFSFVYSYNTIFHMTKKDIKKAMSEMRRVIKKDGLCYVNYMSVEDDMYKEGKEVAKGEVICSEGDEDVLHTFLEDNELPDFLEGFELISYDKRYIKRPQRWKNYTGCYFDCILQKK